MMLFEGSNVKITHMVSNVICSYENRGKQLTGKIFM